jgi:hypothetical protein
MVDMVLLPFRTIDGLWRPDRDLPEGLHIVRDADEWTSLWMQSAYGRPSEPPVLAVNWKTEMCVVAAAGTRSTGGYVVLIDVIEAVDGHLRVLAWEIRPGPNCPTTFLLTHPFHAVAAPARPGEATLVKRIAYEDCGAVGYGASV